MPADVSSLIPPVLDQLHDQTEAAPDELAGLLERLAEIPDPRDPRGVQYALVCILALSACAVLAGATSLVAIGEWIADAPPQVLARLGVRYDLLSRRYIPPGEATVRRVLTGIDGDALDAAVGRWPAHRGAPAATTGRCVVWPSTAEPARRRPGARPQDPPARRPDHTTGLVRAQREAARAGSRS